MEINMDTRLGHMLLEYYQINDMKPNFQEIGVITETRGYIFEQLFEHQELREAREFSKTTQENLMAIGFRPIQNESFDEWKFRVQNLFSQILKLQEEQE